MQRSHRGRGVGRHHGRSTNPSRADRQKLHYGRILCSATKSSILHSIPLTCLVSFLIILLSGLRSCDPYPLSYITYLLMVSVPRPHSPGLLSLVCPCFPSLLMLV
uniref:Uncharacterized protein n=1 Tax=Picea glauca TaxID=3330 RepID=A0A101LYB2_PICGL|nr:hypothetical protein ABT39_MTgene5800 [Picea glauca]QHR90426.1 hypothetical protein Q903MT_gene4450 [Picea sitchensis]